MNYWCVVIRMLTPGHFPSFPLQHVDVAALLIKYNSSVNATDRWNFTPLHEAAQKGRTQLCALLVRKTTLSLRDPVCPSGTQSVPQGPNLSFEDPICPLETQSVPRGPNLSLSFRQLLRTTSYAYILFNVILVLTIGMHASLGVVYPWELDCFDLSSQILHGADVSMKNQEGQTPYDLASVSVVMMGLTGGDVIVDVMVISVTMSWSAIDDVIMAMLLMMSW